ncbi:MAG: hypothetical protein EBX52_11670, partial [Proteobacteria bacterium]|nr:hypothetical protein [Pseudomonadota bacterium]
GLIGAFLDYDAGVMLLHGFASYLVYPENIPNVVIDNGRFQPRHPQAISSIPETVNVLNQPAPLYYEIEYPSIGEFLFRPSLMVSAETRPESPLLLRALYGYKPLNYMNFALRGNFSIPDNHVKIYIKPRLLSNQLISADLGYRSTGNRLSFGISGIAQIPDPEDLSTDYTYAPATSATLVSPWVKWKGADFDGSVSVLWWSGGLDPDIGPFRPPGLPFSARTFFIGRHPRSRRGCPRRFCRRVPGCRDVGFTSWRFRPIGSAEI